VVHDRKLRVSQIFLRAEETGSMAADIECSHPEDKYAVDIWRPDWVLDGIALASDEDAIYVTEPALLGEIVSALWSTKACVVGHNLKFDLMGMKKTFRNPNFPENIADTMIAQNLLDENLYAGQIGLKPSVKRLLGIEMVEFDEVSSDRTSSAFKEYAADDARNTLLLWKHFEPLLEAEGLLHLFNSVHMPMLKVCTDMELLGFRWDFEVAEELIAVYLDKKMQLQQDLSEEFEESINLNSGDQIAKKLFSSIKDGGMGIPTTGVPMTKSKKRRSVDAATLDILAADYPICSRLKDYRHATDMISKYLAKISAYSLDDPNGRTHATTWLISATGRTRQQNPPNQTIPKFTKFYAQAGLEGDKNYEPYKIRRGFNAGPGRVLLKADFSQFQLRLCAHISKDKEMKRAFTSWSCTVCGKSGDSSELLLNCPECHAEPDERILTDPLVNGFWHGLDLHQLTYEACSDVMDSRQDGKTANFALIFMASAKRMHIEYPKFSIPQWEKIIFDFFSKYKGVRAYHEHLEKVMDSGSEVRDIFGRKRRVPKSEIRRSRKHALNQLVNFPVQASEVHYAFLCCDSIRQRLREINLWNEGDISNPGCGIVHFMHDEIIVDAPNNPEIVDKVGKIMLDVMRTRVKLSVPVNAELEVGVSW